MVSNGQEGLEQKELERNLLNSKQLTEMCRIEKQTMTLTKNTIFISAIIINIVIPQ